MSDLERAFGVLDGKLGEYNRLFAYADGNQPLQYSTSRLREAFRDITARFQQNWCSVIIHSALDRMELKGFDTEQSGYTKTLDEIWNAQHLGLDAYDAHDGALVTGEAFVIAWKGEAEIEVYYNDPRLCHVFYQADNPKRKEFAAKWFMDAAAEMYYLTLYYPDRLEYYAAKTKNKPTSAQAFLPAEVPVERNPWGEIPVFHFRTNRRKCSGDLADILTLQDAVNKLLADMMVAAEFGAFKQRWIISNSDTTALKNAPNEIWSIPAGETGMQNTQVGEFNPTDLGNYLDSMDKLANSIAIITRTPKHYFFGGGANISGEALLAMEAPLTKKIQQHEANFGVTWQELGAFLLKLAGAGEVAETMIRPIWAPVGSVQPFTEGQARKLAIDAGIPLVTELKREGWTEADLAAMEQDEEDAREKQTVMATALLEQARLRQEQSNGFISRKDAKDAKESQEAGKLGS